MMAIGRVMTWFRISFSAAILATWLSDATWRPHAVLIVLILAYLPLIQAWRYASGLTLRPAIVWGLIAVSLGIMAQVQGWNEPLESGRPGAGHWAYLSSLATLAGLISVLGARKPGGGAWAILMGLLVVVFLLPWLEGSGLAKGTGGLERLRLDPPWSIFFVVLIVAGVTNYLPTRFWLSACFLGASLLVELIGLVITDRPPSQLAQIWSLSPLLLGLGVVFGIDFRRRPSQPIDSLTRLWLWFRDHWGVVWALRVRERFNRAAEVAGWPVRLGWQGPISPGGGEVGKIPEAAERTLATLLRRFADASRIEGALGTKDAGACSVRDHQGK